MIEKKESNAIPIENQLGLVLSKEAKSYLASLSMPNTDHISMTSIFSQTISSINASDNIFIAPANGWIAVIVNQSTAKGGLLAGYLYNDGNIGEWFRIGTFGTWRCTDRLFAPMTKGAKFYLRKESASDPNPILWDSYFIYAKGEVE